jgi:transcriptional regulator
MTRRASNESGDLLLGTLDLLVLRTLLFGSAHGYGIAEAIQRRSDGVLLVEQGSLYPALQRLESRGWIASNWGTTDSNRRARFYRLTARGRRQLAAESGRWDELARAVARVLGGTAPENAER